MHSMKIRLAIVLIAISVSTLPSFTNVSADFYGYWSTGTCCTLGVVGVLSIPNITPGNIPQAFIGNDYELSNYGGTPAIRVGIRDTNTEYDYFYAFVYYGGAEDYYPMNPVVGTLPSGQFVDDRGQLASLYLNISTDGTWYAFGFSTPHGSVGPFADNFSHTPTVVPSWEQIEQVTASTNGTSYAANGAWAYNSYNDRNYIGHYFTEPLPYGIEWNGPVIIAPPSNTFWYTLPSQSGTGGLFIACFQCS